MTKIDRWIPVGSDYYLWLGLEQELNELLAEEKRDFVPELLAEYQHSSSLSKSPIDQIVGHRLDSARRQADEIRQEMQIREEMRSYFSERIDYQIGEAAFDLSQLRGPIGYNSGVDIRRNVLERQLVQLRKEQREVELRAWNDVVHLRKELRDAVADYELLLRRYGLLSGDDLGDE